MVSEKYKLVVNPQKGNAKRKSAGVIDAFLVERLIDYPDFEVVFSRGFTYRFEESDVVLGRIQAC